MRQPEGSLGLDSSTKGGDPLSCLGRCGTETGPPRRAEGKLKVVSIVSPPGHDENELLRLAATVERTSEHPLADAIVRSANDRKLVLSKVEDFDSPTGKGAAGKVDGKSILLAMRTSWRLWVSRRSRWKRRASAYGVKAPP